MLGERDLFVHLRDHVVQDIVAALLCFIHSGLELVQLGTQQALKLCFDFTEPAASLTYAAYYTNQLRPRALTLYRFGAVLVGREDFLQSRLVSALIGLVRFGHQ